MTVKLRKFGGPGRARLQDVSGSSDILSQGGDFTAAVPKHGVVLLLVTPPGRFEVKPFLSMSKRRRFPVEITLVCALVLQVRDPIAIWRR